MNEFENVLTKMGYRTIGGGATGGRVNWKHPTGDTIVSLSLHPMDKRVLSFEIEKGGQTIAKGDDPTQLLRSLQDKSGSGVFRKVQYAEPSNRTGGHPFRDKFKAVQSESLDDSLKIFTSDKLIFVLMYQLKFSCKINFQTDSNL